MGQARTLTLQAVEARIHSKAMPLILLSKKSVVGCKHGQSPFFEIAERKASPPIASTA